MVSSSPRSAKPVEVLAQLCLKTLLGAALGADIRLPLPCDSMFDKVLVARLESKGEIARAPAAQEATEKAWDRLRSKRALHEQTRGAAATTWIPRSTVDIRLCAMQLSSLPVSRSVGHTTSKTLNFAPITADESTRACPSKGHTAATRSHAKRSTLCVLEQGRVVWPLHNLGMAHEYVQGALHFD